MAPSVGEQHIFSERRSQEGFSEEVTGGERQPALKGAQSAEPPWSNKMGMCPELSQRAQGHWRREVSVCEVG